MKKLAILFALALCAALAGCNQSAPPQGSEPPLEPSGTVSAPPVEGPAEPTPPAVGQVAMVYIGTKAGGFTDYPITYDGDLTPEKLIQGIAGLTGWDLTLAEDVTSGKGGMSVCLSSESSLFTSPPDPQREEFHMYDVGQLAETILDSIQKTLQEGFTLEGGDPDTLDISGITWRGTSPWSFPSWASPGPLTGPISGRERKANSAYHIAENTKRGPFVTSETNGPRFQIYSWQGFPYDKGIDSEWKAGIQYIFYMRQ